jgi:uncharacterized membrane protein
MGIVGLVILVIFAVSVWLLASDILAANDDQRRERMDHLRVASMIRERLEQIARDDEARRQAENWMPSRFGDAKSRTSRFGAN